jgi:hypothetical protein
MRQSAEIADDARQGRGDDILVERRQHERQDQPAENEPEFLLVDRGRRRLKPRCIHERVIEQILGAAR